MIGQKVWDVVSDNRPSANLNTSSASVVPVRYLKLFICSNVKASNCVYCGVGVDVQEGITNWQQLSGWKGPVVLRDTISYSIGVRSHLH